MNDMNIIKNFDLPATIFCLNQLESLIETKTETVQVYNPKTKKKEIHEEEIKDYAKAFEYFKSYFFEIKNSTDFLMYVVEDDKFQHIDKTTMKDKYFDKMDRELSTKILKCKDTPFIVINKNISNRIFLCENGLKYINESKRYKLDQIPIKKYDTFDTTIKQNVQLFIDYIQNVLCSGNKSQCEYILKWLSNVCKGNKNDSALYLSGPEGLGKSTLTVFFRKFVLSINGCEDDDLVLKTDSKCLKDKWNDILCEKFFVCFEELPVFSEYEWQVVSSALKDLITDDKMTKQEKYKNAIQCDNVNNYVICSNFQAIQHSEGRRYFVMDLNTEYCRDHIYFGRIRENCFNKDVGNAFYNYLMELDLSDFYAQKMPDTINKRISRERNIKPVEKMIRDEFISNNLNLDLEGLRQCYANYSLNTERVKYGKEKEIDLKCNITCFYKFYEEYCLINKYKIMCQEDFTRKLRELTITTHKSHGYDVFNYKLDKLKEIMYKFNFENLDLSINENNETEEYVLSKISELEYKINFYKNELKKFTNKRPEPEQEKLEESNIQEPEQEKLEESNIQEPEPEPEPKIQKKQCIVKIPIKFIEPKNPINLFKKEQEEKKTRGRKMRQVIIPEQTVEFKNEFDENELFN